VLLRLSYLALRNVLTLIRLLPMNDGDKNVEILVLRPPTSSKQSHDASQPDLVTDHVRDCDRVDGAGQPAHRSRR
jgi:hypothetical protein